ncbi:hypothetical protein B9Z48_14380 [Limnohabitans sp. WS1]|nr:hypothetical protein B9Z48_14380 [Limnohabitans sp. WS1]
MRLRHLFRTHTRWPRRLVLWSIPLWLLLALWFYQEPSENSGASNWLPPIELRENIQVTPSLASGTQPDDPEPAVSDDSALRSALTRWSETWSARDVPAYLGFYSPDFVPPKGLSKAAWTRLRSDRISSKQSIQISFEKLRLQINGSWATVKFTQVYQDERLRRLDQKTMVWQKREGQWLIQSETTD